MVSVHGLSKQQKDLLRTIVFEFKDASDKVDGLTQRQQDILNGLMKEFSMKNKK
ncbi:MAG: hypothetical protein ACI4RP_01040 [Acutalibacteraceae bacterium]